MSDNPSGEEFLNLGINFDTDGADKQLEEFFSRLEELQTEYLQATLEGSEAAGEFFNRLADIKLAATEQGTALEELNAQLNEVADSFNRLNETAVQIPNASAYNSGDFINQAAAGYGVSGGMIGPAEAFPGDEGSGSGGGSSYGLARGARALGQITGQSGAGNAVADVLYINQAFDQLQGVLEGFNATIEDSPGLLAPVVEGFVELGVPMAGLLTFLGPVAAGIAGVAYEVQQMHNILEAGAAGIKAGADQDLAYNQLLATGTTESLTAGLAKAHDDQAAILDTIDFLSGKRQALIDDKVRQTQANIAAGSTGVTVDDVLANPDRIIGVKELDDQIKALQTKADALTPTISNFKEALGSTTVAANDAALAARQQADEQVAQTARFMALDKLSSEQGKDRVKGLNSDIEVQQRAIDSIQKKSAALDPLSQAYLDAEAAINQHRTTLQNDSNDMQHLLQVSIPAAETREREADAVKKADDALKSIVKSFDDFHKGVTAAERQLADQTASAIAREAQQEAALKNDAFERSKIALDESRKEVAAKLDAANKIDDITAKMDDGINKAFRDLSGKIQEDQIKYWQGVGKVGRDGQIQQREDAIDHLQKLADIQRKQQDGESDALYDRNFRELSKIQSHKNDAINEEDRAYSEREAKLQRHLQDQNNELAVHLSEEMAAQRRASAAKVQELLIAEREQETQIVINENRKLEALRTAEQNQIQDLVTAENHKRDLLRQGLQNELSMLQLVEQQKLAVIASEFAVVNALSNVVQSALHSPLGSLLSGIGHSGAFSGLGGIKLFDQGGSFGSGEPFIMSENRPEALDFGGMGFNVGGAALVYPLQSGSVQAHPGGNSGPVNATFHITVNEATDAQHTAQIVGDQMERRLEELFPQ
jgi:hypothetical protein